MIALLGPVLLLLASFLLFAGAIRFGTLKVKPTRIKSVPPRGLVLHAKRERFVRDVDEFAGKEAGR